MREVQTMLLVLDISAACFPTGHYGSAINMARGTAQGCVQRDPKAYESRALALFAGKSWRTQRRYPMGCLLDDILELHIVEVSL